MAAVPGEVQDLSQIETSSTTYESDGASIEAYLARPTGRRLRRRHHRDS